MAAPRRGARTERDGDARLYRARAHVPELIDVPPARFLAIDGRGEPGDEAFQEAIRALFTVAYNAKFALEKAGGENVKIPPLEGLYSGIGLESSAEAEPGPLSWTLVLRLPEPLDDALVGRTLADARAKGSLPALDRVQVVEIAEDACVQVLHVGPYSAEAPTIELMRTFMRAHGLEPRGPHHEIYLGDPRRAKPERLKTILRQPVG